jgi:hypothetical protein
VAQGKGDTTVLRFLCLQEHFRFRRTGTHGKYTYFSPSQRFNCAVSSRNIAEKLLTSDVSGCSTAADCFAICENETARFVGLSALDCWRTFIAGNKIFTFCFFLLQ